MSLEHTKLGGLETGGPVHLFRREAVEHHARGMGDRGHPLEISPRWTRRVFPLLLLVFVAGVLFTLVGSIHEYASGPAVVVQEGRFAVTATLPGTVATVAVEAGEAVAAGDLLVRFHSAREAAEFDRIHREFELGLTLRLRDPGDRGVARSLSALRAQRRLAAARLEERFVRAPSAGVVGDLRIRPGQHIAPGQTLLTLVEEGREPGRELGIIALLPGHYRPTVQPGMALRFELEGYGFADQHLTVESLGEEVVGPAEARRFLAADFGGRAPSGPVVWVRARLPEAAFESEGRIFRFHDGALGTAEVRVRSEKILPALLPGLRGLFRGSSHG